MPHYVAIIEEGGTAHATGIWFPDIPGCFSAGDTLDEAMANAPEALRLHLDALIADGQQAPPARSLSELKADPAFAEDVSNHMIALISAPALSFRPAAE